ncbi:Chitodextrinase [Micrococcales bacterium KH10]|nr:Chitodextrinase [Micrococcales bacterium KH10]
MARTRQLRLIAVTITGILLTAGLISPATHADDTTPSVVPSSTQARTGTSAQPAAPTATAISQSPGTKPRLTLKKKWVPAGKRATLRLKPKPAGTVTWQVKRHGVGISPTKKWRTIKTTRTNKLTIKAKKSLHKARYRAISSTGIKSNTVRLRVMTKPKISKQPTSQLFRPGMSATLQVKATGGKLRYQWQTKAANSTTWTKIAGSNAKRLTVTASANNSAQYRVVVRNKKGRVTSEAAIIVPTPSNGNDDEHPYGGTPGPSTSNPDPDGSTPDPGSNDPDPGDGTNPDDDEDEDDNGDDFPDPPPPAPYKPQIVYVPKQPDFPSDAQLAADEAALVQAAGTAGGTSKVDLMRSALRVRSDATVNQVVPGRAENPANVRRVEQILPEAKFDELFPVRNTAYSYVNLLRAIAKFRAYCDTYTDGRDSEAICRKLLATSFAHMVQETGANYPALTPAVALAQYPDNANPVLHTMPANTPIATYRQALWYLREISYTEQSRGFYTECYPGSTVWGVFAPCGQDEQGQTFSYFGRGAKQLSYNYNYGQFSTSLYGDANVLLDDPARVADTWLNFASAIWFTVYPQAPKPPMTWVIDGTWQPNSVDLANNMTPGFGATVQIINGGLECDKGTEQPQVVNRIAAYREFAHALGVLIPADEMLGCATSKGFTAGSAAATDTYLDQDWSWNSSNPSGKSYKCKPVAYQTPFNLAATGDYEACVDYFFRGQVWYQGELKIDNT